jgi:dTDP-4-dehydrorhamnose reductase
MKVLIFGSTGMLGRALMREASSRKLTVTGAARHDADLMLDITDDSALAEAITRLRPDIIINCAALVNHDKCEKNPEPAYRVNARAVGIMAESASKTGSYLVQISTDHYYTGDVDLKHPESFPVRLINEYARTKYAGEIFALTCAGALVVRTNIVGFRDREERPSFAEWVIRALNENAPITMFDDFYTSSLHVVQFAKALFDLLERRPMGIVNLASREVSSKRAFIESLAKHMNRSLQNAATGSVKSLAGTPRAESLGLNVAKAEKLLGYRLPTLDEVILSLMKEYKEKYG